MAQYKTNYGGNLTEIFTLSSSWQPTATGFAGAAVGLSQNFTTAFAGHEKTKDLVATVTHETFDSTITDFFDTYLSETTTTTDEKYEDSKSASTSSVTAGATAGGAFLAIAYSGKSSESTPKRYVKTFPSKLEGGGFTMEADKTIRPETRLVAVAAGATITVPAALYNTAKVTGAATVTIPSGAYGLATWMTSAVV